MPRSVRKPWNNSSTSQTYCKLINYSNKIHIFEIKVDPAKFPTGDPVLTSDLLKPVPLPRGESHITNSIKAHFVILGLESELPNSIYFAKILIGTCIYNYYIYHEIN